MDANAILQSGPTRHRDPNVSLAAVPHKESERERQTQGQCGDRRREGERQAEGDAQKDDGMAIVRPSHGLAW